MKDTISYYLMDYFASLGLKKVFFVPGGGNMFLVDAIGRHPEIDFVSTHNEQAAVIAAEAYTRLTNSIGIALVTTGPGATNSITGADLGFCDTNGDTGDTCRPLQDKVSCQNVNSCSWTDTPIDCKQGGNVSALVATHPKQRCCTDGGPKDCYDSHTYLVFQLNNLDRVGIIYFHKF